MGWEQLNLVYCTFKTSFYDFHKLVYPKINIPHKKICTIFYVNMHVKLPKITFVEMASISKNRLMKQKLFIVKKETSTLVFFGNLKDLTFGNLKDSGKIIKLSSRAS